MVTPQIDSPEIARELGLNRLYLKREDLHPYGSHKGRSIPLMIDMKVGQGFMNFAISSSGNAALAAVRHVQKRNNEGDNLTLSILLGPHMNPEKLERLYREITDERVTITQTPRPLQTLMMKVRGKSFASLRQSTDALALLGYKALAAEIAATPGLEAVFIATSSGTTAEALASYLGEHKKGVSIHIVQTREQSSIASAFDSDVEKEDSLADAIIDRVAHRRTSVQEAIKNSNGSGWIASNADIVEAQRLLHEKADIDATPNGALSLAGLIKARRKGIEFKGSVVCIITGR